MEDLALKHEIILLIVISLLSGFAGAALTVAWQIRAEKRRIKLALLTELQTYSTGDPRFIEAFNKVPLIFNDSQHVTAAFDRAYNAHQLPSDYLAELLVVAMIDIGIPHPHRDCLMHRLDTKPKAPKPEIKPSPKEKEEMERWDVERRALRDHRRRAGAS